MRLDSDDATSVAADVGDRGRTVLGLVDGPGCTDGVGVTEERDGGSGRGQARVRGGLRDVLKEVDPGERRAWILWANSDDEPHSWQCSRLMGWTSWHRPHVRTAMPVGVVVTGVV